jgi:hypothetical protein
MQKYIFFFYDSHFMLDTPMSEPTKPIPIALPTRLVDEFTALSQQLDISRAELMRLCMRIGLVDLRAAEHDLPGIVKLIADDKGVSFCAFANSESEFTTQSAAAFAKNATCADDAVLPTRSQTHQPPLASANIVQLPPPPVLSTLMHDSLSKVAETPGSHPVTESRQDIVYPAAKRKGK